MSSARFALPLPAQILNRHRLLIILVLFPTDGFFDAGMLLQALKANKDEKPSEKAVGMARKAVGKKLRLSEY